MAELELIAAVERALRAPGPRLLQGPGDDAAVVRARPLAVTSVDTVVDGVHFTLATHSAADVGHKAMGSALSDLAAMAAAPGEAYVALALPDGFAQHDALALVEAMETLAARADVAIAGGDVVSSPTLVVTVSVTGWADHRDDLAFRDGAGAGDLLGVTGELGGSGAGLLLLGGLEVDLTRDRREALLGRHRRPEPRLRLGQALRSAGATAMIDVSDGVATDARHLATRSGVHLVVDLTELPLAPGVLEVAAAAGRDPEELAATAGEDYELLFTCREPDRRRVEAAAHGEGSRTSWIGRVEPGQGVALVGAGGRPVTLRGFEHG